LATAVVAVAVGLPVVGRASGRVDSVAFRPRVPSQAPPQPSILTTVEAEPEWWTHPATIDPEVLEQTLTDWATQNGVPGASVAVSVPGGGSWVGATGVTDDGDERGPQTVIDAMSITKLFTANLVYRAVDLGLLGLDDPIPPITALPDLPLVGKVTVRQLLAHRSGLVNYRDTEQYHIDPSVVQGPADAVALSLGEPVSEPGASALYSSTNYLILGYLLEQVTGVSFDDMLASALLQPMGLQRTVHLAPAPGEPRFATAGIVTDIEELARAGEELLVNHVGISDDAWRQMSAMDPEAGLGAGTMQFCPCSESDGVTEVFALGYAGGHTLVAHLPRYDVVVALDITGDFYGDEGHFEAVEPLLRSLAGLLRPPPGPGAPSVGDVPGGAETA
jgi:CubicO group peptidase (beta-lactamase class C family)